MQLLKAFTVLAFLALASCAVPAQENVVPQRTAGEPKPPVAILNWNEKPDVTKWLRKNESALNRGDACTLSYSWMNEENPYPSSSVHEIASFVAAPPDEEMTRLIREPRSGVDVRLGVRYNLAGGPGGLYALQIALAFEGPTDGVFDEISRAEAETLRYTNWNWGLNAVKLIRVGTVRYRFSFRCENGRTFLSFLRRPIKHSAGKSAKQ